MLVNGVQLDYELHPGMSSRFNQKMFGRISWRKTPRATYTYYIPGVLHNIPHHRIFEGRIFIGTAQQVNYDEILQYCSKFITSTTTKNEKEIFLQTAEQKWKVHSREKGYNVEWI